MNIITTSDIIDNARLNSEQIAHESQMLTLIGDTAEQTVLNLIDRSYYSLLDEFGTIPPPIKTACIMLATHLYEQRTPLSAVNLSTVPYTIDCLLKPYIRFN